MALDDNYIQLTELQAYIRVDDSRGYDIQLQEVINSSTAEINRHCHRNFNKADAATTRTYPPIRVSRWHSLIMTDDISTLDGLIVTAGDKTYDLSELDFEPPNGLMQGEPWPYTVIHGDFHCRVSVTAVWGWPTVPAPVKQAAYYIAQDSFQMKDQRLGIAGSDQFGSIITIRDNRPAQMKLKRYIKDAVLMDS